MEAVGVRSQVARKASRWAVSRGQTDNEEAESSKLPEATELVKWGNSH